MLFVENYSSVLILNLRVLILVLRTRFFINFSHLGASGNTMAELQVVCIALRGKGENYSPMKV